MEDIRPEDITLVIMAVNSGTHKMGKFERMMMQKLKTYLIKNCDIENAVDFSDYALVDKQLAFYEQEGTFKLDFTANNKERFIPGTVLLIIETFYRTDSMVDVMGWACWMTEETESLVGGKLRVGGTYLPGFATSAYFLNNEIEAYPKISVHVQGSVGADRLKALMESGLAEKGYSVFPANTKETTITVEARLNAVRCFEEIESCYKFSLDSLRIKDSRNILIMALPSTAQGKEKYAGYSIMTDKKTVAVRTGVNRLWDTMKEDFLDAVRSCL
jgi:hypothetical protein